MEFKLYVHISSNIPNVFEDLIDDEFKTFAHKRLGDNCEPYVPFLEGNLDQGREATAEFLRYPPPYAHFQYIGEVMVGVVTGKVWADKYEKKVYKKPTQMLEYTKLMHPLATSMWDLVAMEAKGDEMFQEFEKYLRRKARDL